ncbi:hypothetical protein [Pedobacter deserti]|uniref:hypothetical protein n=1 Tax=Pedobacter deserti TaxID=2817382 RepID=UPI002109B81A|nr:hypothetical protein [Pedobacter sp. SYSU D00382]
MQKLKVLFFITSSDTSAKGGHFRSCLTLANSLSKEVEIEIINIGKVRSPVFDQNEIKVTFIKMNLVNFIRNISLFSRQIASDDNAKLVAFDFFAYFFVRNIALFRKLPVAFVRCGGKNPAYSPFSSTVFTFSKENYDHYVKNEIFNKSNIILVPNRIKKLDEKELKRSSIRKVVGNDHPIILRVGRIVANYQQVNDSAIKLSRFLNANAIPHNLVFIGYPDVPGSIIYNELKKEVDKSENIFLLDTPDFTNKSSIFLNEADLVVGTGRGAMEAIVESRPLAVYSRSAELPVIVNSDEIFYEAFNRNFSKRVSLSLASISGYEGDILAFFNDKAVKQSVLRYQKTKRQYFDIDLARGLYIDGFLKMKYDHQVRIFDYLKHFKIFWMKIIYMSIGRHKV